MNEHIEEYTHEMLIDFYYFLILYEGRLGVRDIKDVSIHICDGGKENRELKASEAMIIIEKFIENQK